MASRSKRRWCSAVVTGAGTGLGREIALGYAARDCIVFGTASSFAEVEDLRRASGGRVSLAVSDVTKFTKGKVWAQGVSDALDGAGLDILINRASLVLPGPIEAIPFDNARHVLEENILGAMSIINAFLPALRRSKGRIVQIIETGACASTPFSGLQAVSSAALDALLSAYRAELKPCGVEVSVAWVGYFEDGKGSSIAENLLSVANNMEADQRELYGRRLAACAAKISRSEVSGLSAVEAARSLIEIAERDPAPRRVAVGSDAEAILDAALFASDDKTDSARLDRIGES